MSPYRDISPLSHATLKHFAQGCASCGLVLQNRVAGAYQQRYLLLAEIPACFWPSSLCPAESHLAGQGVDASLAQSLAAAAGSLRDQLVT